MTRLAYILAATASGPMLVNRLDYAGNDKGTYGVGAQLLETGVFDPEEVALGVRLLQARREAFGPGVMVMDCGANIGTHTIAWAKAMEGWGQIVALEAQERVFYALSGNITLNNLFNARALWAAVSDADGEMETPDLDHQAPASFGSLELNGGGVDVCQSTERRAVVQTVRIDTFGLGRLDLLKLDVEGMELQALAGAAATIRQQRPIVMAEWIKTGKDAIGAVLSGHGYKLFEMGINVVGVHESDPVAGRIIP